MNRASLLGDVRDGRCPSTAQDLLDADDAVAASSRPAPVRRSSSSVWSFIIWQWRHAKNAQRSACAVAWPRLGDRWLVRPAGELRAPGDAAVPEQQGVRPRRAACGAVAEGRRGRSSRGRSRSALGAIVLAGSGALVSSDDEGNVIIESAEDIEDAESSDQSAAFGFVLSRARGALGDRRRAHPHQRQAAAYASVAATAPPHTLGAPPPPPPGARPARPSTRRAAAVATGPIAECAATAPRTGGLRRPGVIRARRSATPRRPCRARPGSRASGGWGRCAR